MFRCLDAHLYLSVEFDFSMFFQTASWIKNPLGGVRANVAGIERMENFMVGEESGK